MKHSPSDPYTGPVHHYVALMMQALGLDMTDPNMEDTPERIGRMYFQLFRNVGKEFEGWTVFPNEVVAEVMGISKEHPISQERRNNQIIMLDNIHFVSTCSHHFLPFVGKAWVLYIPDKVLVGASKPARCIEHYAAMPQIQENLCGDVLSSFVKHAKPLACMVMMRAIHQCMSCRGVNQYGNAGMTNSAIHGVFLSDSSAKAEALEMIKISMM